MSTTYLDLKIMVTEILNRGDITASPISMVPVVVNWGLTAVQQRINLPCMRGLDEDVTEVDHFSYDYPSMEGLKVYKEMIQVHLFDTTSVYKRYSLYPLRDHEVFASSVMHPISEAIFDLSDSEVTGIPVFWGEWEGDLILRPTPDAEYFIEWTFYGILDDLSADSDYNDITNQYTEIITLKALRRAYFLLGEQDLATTFRNEAEMAFQMLRRAKTQAKPTLSQPGKSLIRIPGS